jgi:hypothetical protein
MGEPHRATLFHHETEDRLGAFGESRQGAMLGAVSREARE